jgi:hypothetical protein
MGSLPPFDQNSEMKIETRMPSFNEDLEEVGQNAAN